MYRWDKIYHLSNLMSEEMFASLKRGLSAMTCLGDDKRILNGYFDDFETGIDHTADLKEWE